MATANDVLEWNRLRQGRAKKSTILFVFRLADSEGTIQAGNMRRVTSDPREHTTSSLRHALCLVGCEPDED